MTTRVDVAVIGAGSAGLTALRQVQKSTDSYVLIDPGPLGTTCARVGCMPSKALIQVARDMHRRGTLAAEGIRGGEGLSVDLPRVLQHVRRLRDRFTQGMVASTHKRAGRRYVQGRAEFLAPNRLRVNGNEIEAGHVVLATGASPIVPGAWEPFADRILTSETIFEQNDLPPRMAVIGLGAIGLELGQALARLGIEVTGFSLLETIGGLSDPAVNDTARSCIEREFPMHLGKAAELADRDGAVEVRAGSAAATVDKVLVAMGVRPRLRDMGLDRLGLDLDERGVPPFDPRTTQVGDLPLFIAGDVNGCRPILHEALDEGFIAGRNAGADAPACHCRRAGLRVVFSDPELAVAGRSYAQLKGRDVLTGTAAFDDQSRAVIEGSNHGLVNVYAAPGSGHLLGAELAAPEAEHLAHLLALAIQHEMTVFDVLRMPFYHPTVEEGLRTALRDVAAQLPERDRDAEIQFCDACPEPPLC